MEQNRIRKHLSTVLFLFATAACLLVGCGTDETVDANQIYVGVACYDQSDIFVSELVRCFKESLSRDRGSYEVMVTVRDAVGSQKTQNDQIKEMIDEGCNVLCVNLADRTDPSQIIEYAKENNVPIIFFNREPVAEDLMRWDQLYYVGAKALQSGVMQGELAVAAIMDNKAIDRNQDGVIQYVILEGEMGHQDAIVRTESVVEYIRSKGIKLEKLGCETANWKRAQAQNRMDQLITQYGNSIELVLANNDDMALGALDSYQQMRYTQNDMPAVFGIDGIREALEAVKASRLEATVYNDKEGQAKAMSDLVFASVSGEGFDKIDFVNMNSIYLPYQKVTAENVDTYLDADAQITR